MNRRLALPGRLVLLGHPVAHSLSPAFQNAALESAGIALRYEALDVAPAELAQALRDLGSVGGAGNVTIPHKRAVHDACDALSAVARRAGAVNTFWHEAGTLCGDNTDVAGFEQAAAGLGVQRPGARVVLLGAGGAAAAVCAAVELWPGAAVRIVARNADRARALARSFPDLVVLPRDATEALKGASLVVNATPIGMHGTAVPLSTDELPGDADVMDLVYRAGETTWVRDARARGLRAADGREMLLQQGAAAFSRWFGRAPDLIAMRLALVRASELG